MTANAAPPRHLSRKEVADERLRPMRRAWGKEWGKLASQVAAQRRNGQ